MAMEVKNKGGRPKGAKDKHPRRVRIARYTSAQAKALLSDVDPLDEMLRMILTFREQAAAGDLTAAAIVLKAAAEAATYTKARLKPMEYAGKLSLEQMIERLSREQVLDFLTLIRTGRVRGGVDGAGEGAGSLDAGPVEQTPTGSVH